MIFAIRLKRKKENQGRKYPVVPLGKKIIERILNRKVGVSGRRSAF